MKEKTSLGMEHALKTSLIIGEIFNIPGKKIRGNMDLFQKEIETNPGNTISQDLFEVSFGYAHYILSVTCDEEGSMTIDLDIDPENIIDKIENKTGLVFDCTDEKFIVDEKEDVVKAVYSIMASIDPETRKKTEDEGEGEEGNIKEDTLKKFATFLDDKIYGGDVPDNEGTLTLRGIPCN